MKLFYKLKNRIIKYFNKPIAPPSYEIKRAILANCTEQYDLNILVETGTFLGDTVEFFKKKFKSIYSIELSEELARKANMRFENDDNITIIQGDSGKELSSLVNQFNEPALFWLDGHYSSEFFVGEEYIKTGRGEKDTPVEQELKVILGSTLNHVILIDDARLFLGLNDYPSILKIKQIVKKLKNNYLLKVENDIIHITPKKSIDEFSR